MLRPPRDHATCLSLTSVFFPTSHAPSASTRRVTDSELVDRARHGDSGAFGDLVDRHRDAVYRAALAALRSPADAEDVAQEAFVIAYEKLPELAVAPLDVDAVNC